jgi:hypothetical protein
LCWTRFPGRTDALAVYRAALAGASPAHPSADAARTAWVEKPRQRGRTMTCAAWTLPGASSCCMTASGSPAPRILGCAGRTGSGGRPWPTRSSTRGGRVSTCGHCRPTGCGCEEGERRAAVHRRPPPGLGNGVVSGGGFVGSSWAPAAAWIAAVSNRKSRPRATRTGEQEAMIPCVQRGRRPPMYVQFRCHVRARQCLTSGHRSQLSGDIVHTCVKGGTMGIPQWLSPRCWSRAAARVRSPRITGFPRA